MFFKPLRLDVAKGQNFPVGGYGSLGVSGPERLAKRRFFS